MVSKQVICIKHTNTLHLVEDWVVRRIDFVPPEKDCCFSHHSLSLIVHTLPVNITYDQEGIHACPD